MSVQAYMKASGVRVHAGEKGRLYSLVGQIFNPRGSIKGIDSSLWAVLKIAVDQLHLCISISSVDTGKHVSNSRHWKGLAVDISGVGNGGDDPEKLLPASLGNPAAMRLFWYLRSAGFRIGERVGGVSVAGLIFGPPSSKYNPTGLSHQSHLHVSLPALYKKE